MDGQINGWIDKWMDRQIDRQMDRQIDIWIDRRKIDKWKEGRQEEIMRERNN